MLLAEGVNASGGAGSPAPWKLTACCWMNKALESVQLSHEGAGFREGQLALCGAHWSLCTDWRRSPGPLLGLACGLWSEITEQLYGGGC